MMEALFIIGAVLPLSIIAWLLVCLVVYVLFSDDGPLAPLVARFRRTKEKSN